jgi:purine-nucleoside phosphorylase
VLDRVIHHEEVMEIGRRVEGQFSSLVKALVPQVAGTIAETAG